MTVDQEKVSLEIRAALEIRLAQVLNIERADYLPVMSIAEIVSLLFGLYGQSNILGGFRETTSAIRVLIGEELFWRRPKAKSEGPEVSATVQ